jgi:hypothetical protein
MPITSLSLENVSQITKADITFGDLTVLVGPQATGKSIFLQFLKLFSDIGAIQANLKRYGSDWEKNLPDFLELYFGEGMSGIWSDKRSRITLNRRSQDLERFVVNAKKNRDDRVFLIPAQRVLTMKDGWPRPFSDFTSGDPFCVRYFSERLRMLMETELGKKDMLFPKSGKLKKEIRDMLESSVFGSFNLKIERIMARKRLVLGAGKNGSLPFMVWSAGQREFVPLLLPLYWLLPAGGTDRKSGIQDVIIEELEMGLHPKAITVALVLIMDLLSRGYRVSLSTHSPQVLDLVWGLRLLQKHKAQPQDVLEILDVKASQQMLEMAGIVLGKKAKVFYFDRRHGVTKDISDLDPGASDEVEAEWGGLGEFTSRVNEVVARVVSYSRGRLR